MTRIKKEPRPARFGMAYLNIVTHPHSPDLYRRLFIAALGLKEIIRFPSQTHIFMHSLAEVGNSGDESDVKCLSGVLYRYTEIDYKQSWLDIITGKIAEPAELERVNVPTNLKPHFKSFRFFFNPRTHLLTYASEMPASLNPDRKASELTPERAKEFFERLLNAEKLRLAFPAVTVSVVQERDQIARLKKWESIRRLEICYTRPNPNDGEDEREFLAELEAMNATEFRQEVRSSTEGITITPNLEARINVALQNGAVSAEGRDSDNLPASLATANHPRREVGFARRDQTFTDAFHAAVDQ